MLEPEGIIIHEDGSISSHGETRERLRAVAGEYALAMDARGAILLRRELAPKIQLAGEILTPMTVMEILNVIASAGWRGQLTVGDGEETRVLVLDQGAVKGARSTAAPDRLGEVLYRAGAVSRAQLDQLVDDTGGKRLGELAVERGYVEAQQLYKYLQQQVEGVFFGALIAREGHFLFTEGEEADTTTVHLPIQGLLMEGVQRIDEMALFRDKVPSGGMCPKAIAGAPQRELEESAQAVLALCDGQRTIDTISRETGLGEFKTTKAIYSLLQQSQIELFAPSTIEHTRAHALIAQFNEVLQDIFVAVATYGGLAQTRATLDAWIAGSGYDPFFGGAVDDLGSIDIDHVVGALKNARAEHPLEALHQALHELAAFALFSATTVLPREQELALARDVNSRLKAIRLG